MSTGLVWKEPRGIRLRLQAPDVRINRNFVKPIVRAGVFSFCAFFVVVQFLYKETFPYLILIAGGIFTAYCLSYVVWYWGMRLLIEGIYRIVPRRVEIRDGEIIIASILDKPRRVKVTEIETARIEHRTSDRRVLFLKTDRGESRVGIAFDVPDSLLVQSLGRTLEVSTSSSRLEGSP